MILVVWELFAWVESCVLLVAAHIVGVVLWIVRWWIDRMWDRIRGRGNNAKEDDAAEDDSCEMHLEVHQEVAIVLGTRLQQNRSSKNQEAKTRIIMNLVLKLMLRLLRMSHALNFIMLTSMLQVCFCTKPYQPLPSLAIKSKHRFDSKQGRG
jgi:hypothetical protein